MATLYDVEISYFFKTMTTAFLGISKLPLNFKSYQN